MRNRAKCKLCLSIIESYHSTDYVKCLCEEIAVDGGEALKCHAKDWVNFLRIDEDDKEVSITVKKSQQMNAESNENKQSHDTKPNKDDIIALVDNMIKDFEALPQHAMNLPITHYDFMSLLMIISSFFKSSTT
jgi:hypothetical protein